jgi:protein NrfC
VVNLSLARIQVAHDHLGKFPDDAMVAQCRQCVEPECVTACPVEALGADGGNGNVRTVDAEKCIGCRECIEACPHPPARTVWNHEIGRAQKCDLCAGASFWKESGGPGGKNACIEICPMRAIAYTSNIPDQSGDAGYVANLRGEAWKVFGFTAE